MTFKEDLKKALAELRKTDDRNFEQTVDLIINLRKFNVRKNPLNIIINVPHKIKDKKVGGFFESKNKNVETITPNEFKKYSDKKKLRNIGRKFDFFIADAKLMPKVAKTFGRVLGPAGKMPSPQMGIIRGNINDEKINNLKKIINSSIKLKAKEASIKLAVGKESMKDKEIIENVLTIYNKIVKALPQDKENIKNVQIKFTMTKPQKIQVR